MKVLIIEDEKLAAERLETLVKGVDPSIEVVGQLESIEETVSFLNAHTHPDLLLLDIQLSDGPGFEIFKRTNFSNAVIFTTAYDEYALQTFQFNSIDYILKPVTREALARAINKMQKLASCLSLKKSTIDSLPCYKTRFVGRVGQRQHFIDSKDIAFFQADNKITILVDLQGMRYVVDHRLERLEEMLNPSMFFRLNRKYIVQINAIQHIKPYHNHRLKLSVSGGTVADEMIISREKVQDFKHWAESA